MLTRRHNFWADVAFGTLDSSGCIPKIHACIQTAYSQGFRLLPQADRTFPVQGVRNILPVFVCFWTPLRDGFSPRSDFVQVRDELRPSGALGLAQTRFNEDEKI